MAQVQFVYGNSGSEEKVLMQSRSFTTFMERHAPSTSKESFNKLVGWFLTDRDTNDPACGSFVYCPVGLAPDNIPTAAAYGVNNAHSFQRPSSYLHLFLSELKDLEGSKFFGIFSAHYLTSKEAEAHAGSITADPAPIEFNDADHNLDDKAIPDSALKAILLQLFRGEKAYIITDDTERYNERTLQVFKYVYSFLPSPVRLATGCLSCKPLYFVQGLQLHANIRLLFMMNHGNNLTENSIQLNAGAAAFLARDQEEEEFLSAVDALTSMPFLDRINFLDMLPGLLSDGPAPPDSLASYTKFIQSASKEKQWWESSEKTYTLQQLRKMYDSDEMLRKIPTFKQRFVQNLPQLMNGTSIQELLDDHFTRADTAKELIEISDDIRFLVDDLGAHEWEDSAFISEAIRVYSRENAFREWLFMQECFKAGKTEEIHPNSTFQRKLFNLYAQVDKRYDADWLKAIPLMLYNRWENIHADEAIDEILKVYEYEKNNGGSTLKNWDRLNEKINEISLQQYITHLIQRKPRPEEALEYLSHAIDFAFEYNISLLSSNLEKISDHIFKSILDTKKQVESQLAHIKNKKGPNQKKLYDIGMWNKTILENKENSITALIQENGRLKGEIIKMKNSVANLESELENKTSVWHRMIHHSITTKSQNENKETTVIRANNLEYQ